MGLSGLFGGMLPGLAFPGGGIGFLGGTTGAAGLRGLGSGVGLSTRPKKEELGKQKNKKQEDDRDRDEVCWKHFHF